MPDYPKAAEKNLSDAKVLLEKERWDGAAYHAGFVVECTLNALLVKYGGKTNLPHKLSLLETCVNSAGRGQGKRCLSPTQSHILSMSGINGWHPNIRYEAAFVHTPETAKKWVDAARNFYHSVKP